MNNPNLKIGFVGGGNMAQALISGLLKKGISPHNITVSDCDPSKLKQLKTKFKIHTTLQNNEVAQKSDYILLAIKPQEMKNILSEIAPFISSQVLISIAAGIDLETLAKPFSQKTILIRSMPNNPALIGEGITALFTRSKLNSRQQKQIEEIFLGSGDVLWVQNEKDLDAVTGLSGSGPAYVYRFVQALARAGEKVGLSADIAYQLALKTCLGASKTLEKTGKKPEELIPLVTSKKGTTLAGLDTMKKNGWDLLLEKTVKAATKRAQEIRKELKK